MSTQNPNKKDPQNNTPADDSGVDQSEALKKAILKLKQSGMLTHVPDELQNIAAEDAPASPEKPSPEPAPKKAEKSPRPGDPTITSRPGTSSPTLASTDDVEKHSDERAKWAAVMSGWNDDAALPEPSTVAPTIPSRPEINTQDDEETGDIAPISSDDAWELPQTTEPEPQKTGNDNAAITISRREIKPPAKDTALTESRDQTPWTLQQFFDGEIDLEQELLKRHQRVPAMTNIKFRTLGMNSSRKVATLVAQDDSSQIIIDADVATKVVQISFTYGSMMTLRYVLSDLPATTRERWLDLMRRDKGGLAFLWNEDRWREDYLICISREYATNIFAFSPRNFESAIRMTKDVTNQLLDWLEEVWNSEPEPDDEDDAPLLTW